MGRVTRLSAGGGTGGKKLPVLGLADRRCRCPHDVASDDSPLTPTPTTRSRL